MPFVYVYDQTSSTRSRRTSQKWGWLGWFATLLVLGACVAYVMAALIVQRL